MLVTLQPSAPQHPVNAFMPEKRATQAHTLMVLLFSLLEGIAWLNLRLTWMPQSFEASTISTIVNIKIYIGILQGFVCLFNVRGPPKNGIRDSPISISLKRLPLHNIFYSPLSQFILATESRCFTELWDGQLGAKRKGETKRWDVQISVYFCALCLLWQGRELLAS